MSEDLLKALIQSVAPTITAIAALLQVTRSRQSSHSTPEQTTPSEPHPPPPRPRQWTTTLLVGAAVTLVVVLLVQVVFNGDDDEKREDVQEQVTVDGKERYTDTGIELDEGDVVTVTATGEVFHSVELRQKATPNGDLGKRYPSNVLQSSDHGSLIGKVGDGPPFHVGVHVTFIADRQGTFFLGINDTGVANNDGAFVADVDVRRKR